MIRFPALDKNLFLFIVLKVGEKLRCLLGGTFIPYTRKYWELNKIEQRCLSSETASLFIESTPHRVE